MKDRVSKSEIDRHFRRDVIVHIILLVTSVVGTAIYFAVEHGADIDLWCKNIFKP